MFKDVEKNRNILIVGSGRSTIDYKVQIQKFIKQHKCVIIGINNMSHIFVPDYHIWTNAQRWKAFSSCIKPASQLLLGSSIKDKMIPIKFKENFIRINKIDKIGTPLGYNGGVIYGYFRSAGALSIMIAHIMAAKNIFVAGMDGHTKYDRKDVESGKESQHCYGKGYTDDKDWASCVKADRLIYKCLRSLFEYGINFRIITPTMYEEFYDDTILEV